MSGIPRTITAYSDEELAKARVEEARLSEARRKAISALSPFERGFARHLTGGQLSALVRLSRAMEVLERAGNATSAYDGVGLGAVQFAAKTLSDAAIDAGRLIDGARRAVKSEVEPRHVGAWRLVERALVEQLGPFELGQAYTRIILRDRMSPDGSRKRAIRIMSLCGAAVENFINRRD